CIHERDTRIHLRTYILIRLEYLHLDLDCRFLSIRFRRDLVYMALIWPIGKSVGGHRAGLVRTNSIEVILIDVEFDLQSFRPCRVSSYVRPRDARFARAESVRPFASSRDCGVNTPSLTSPSVRLRLASSLRNCASARSTSCFARSISSGREPRCSSFRRASAAWRAALS